MRDLASEVLEEFCCAGSPTRSERWQDTAAWIVDLGVRRRMSSRESHALARLARDGTFIWRVCPECQLEFAVVANAPGRPRIHCCPEHAHLARVRAYRARRAARLAA